MQQAHFINISTIFPQLISHSQLVPQCSTICIGNRMYSRAIKE